MLARSQNLCMRSTALYLLTQIGYRTSRTELCCWCPGSKKTALAKQSQMLADVQRAADAHVDLTDSLPQVHRTRLESSLPCQPAISFVICDLLSLP
jgi:hypothetical protein